jgi:hypothetical protein
MAADKFRQSTCVHSDQPAPPETHTLLAIPQVTRPTLTSPICWVRPRRANIASVMAKEPPGAAFMLAPPLTNRYPNGRSTERSISSHCGGHAFSCVATTSRSGRLAVSSAAVAWRPCSPRPRNSGTSSWDRLAASFSRPTFHVAQCMRTWRGGVGCASGSDGPDVDAAVPSALAA